MTLTLIIVACLKSQPTLCLDPIAMPDPPGSLVECLVVSQRAAAQWLVQRQMADRYFVSRATCRWGDRERGA